jgi:hypothetical protein
MTLGQKAFKTKIYIGDGESPEVFTKIDEVFSIGPVGGTKELVDFTNHDTEDYYDYEVFDLKDGKEIQVEANEIFGNTSQGLVRTADANSTKDNWKIVYRDGSYDLFPGLVMSAETDPSDLKNRVIFRFTIKIAGAVTRVPFAA